MKRTILISLIFVLFSLTYYLILDYLFCKYEYIHSNLIFFAQKAMLAKEGSPSRLENISFFYPPISFIPFLLVNDPIKVTSVISGIISTILFFTIINRYSISLKDVFILVLFFFNPLYLLISVTRFDVLLFYFLFSLALLFLYTHLRSNKTFYSFLSGLFFGICFYLDFRVIFILPIILVLIFFSKRDGSLFERLSTFIVISSPLVFFFLSWVYLNYLFMSDGFLFLKTPYSFIKSQGTQEVVLASSSLVLSFFYVLNFLFKNIGVILPYIVQLFFIRGFRLVYLLSFLVVYILPIFFYLFSVYSSAFSPYAYTSMLLVFTSLFFYFENKTQDIRNISKITLLSFVFSFIFSFIAPLSSFDLNERFFIKAVFNAGKDFDISKREEIEMSNILKKFNCQKILSDDINTFEVIFFYGDVKKFILPYNYEFTAAVSNPYNYVDCVLLNLSDEDLKKRLGSSFNYFTLAAKTERYHLYVRSGFLKRLSM